jgi:hypothetical protein
MSGPVRWKGPVLALLGAAAVAGIAIGLTLGRSDSGDAAGTTIPGSSLTADRADKGGTTVANEADAKPGHEILVGSVDDSLKQADQGVALGFARTSREAGFDAALVSSMWTPGSTAPAAAERTALRNVVRAATRQHLELFVQVWHGLSDATPRTTEARRQFATYAASLARTFPQIRNVIVGNEPNLNTFWLPQFGPDGSDVAANAYLDLLAQTYDALKAVSPDVLVIGGSLAPRGSDRPSLKRDTHSPTRFIKDLGAAYRASGRTKPLMDGFAIHPYMRTSSFPPSDTHASSTTITIGDYAKLVSLLGSAFDGTAQQGSGMPIYYTEFGVQTEVPEEHRSAYTDLKSPAALDVVDTETQARYYREALALAACQPTVRGLFVFHTFDEKDLAGWQSGLYYADQKPKGSLDDFREAAKDARDASLTRCAGGTFVRKE